jgi:hypothetical protein
LRHAKSVYIKTMCGRATYKLTWEEIVALYRLTPELSFGNLRVETFKLRCSRPLVECQSVVARAAVEALNGSGDQ